MDSQTLELFRWLQSGPYDESGLERIRGRLQGQRTLLRARNDVDTLGELIDLLEAWAQNAVSPRFATLAMLEASDIAERELQQPERASQLRAKASADADQRDAERQAASFVTLGTRRIEAGDLDGAIEAYDKALEADASVEVIYGLADLYTQRAKPGDAEQAADLYCTLGEALGNPDGIAMLERALALQPKHTAARALFDTYVASASPPIPQPAAPSFAQAPALQFAPPPLQPMAAGHHAQPMAVAHYRQPAAAGRLVPPKPRGWSTLPPIEVEDATLVEPGRGGWTWLIAGSLLTAASAAAFVFAISTGRMTSGKTVVSNWLVTMGVMSKPPTLPTTPTLAAASGAAKSGTAVDTATVPPTAPPAAAETPKTEGIAAETPKTEGIAAETPKTEGIAAETPKTEGIAAAAPSTAAHAAIAPEPTASPSANAAGDTGDSDKHEAATVRGAVRALVEQASVRGGKLNGAQLSAAITKATPKIERCYAAALKEKPRTKGKLTFGWTVRPNGKAASVKAMGGSIKDADLGNCTAQVIGATRFPKPQKRAAQVKLAIEYKRQP